MAPFASDCTFLEIGGKLQHPVIACVAEKRRKAVPEHRRNCRPRGHRILPAGLLELAGPTGDCSLCDVSSATLSTPLLYRLSSAWGQVQALQDAQGGGGGETPLSPCFARAARG